LGGVTRLAGLAFVAALTSSGAAFGVAAQTLPDSPFLFINQERLLTGSAAGQALLADEERERDALRTEARALDSAFETEERQLTEKRPAMAPEDFRALADAFDARVVQARREQDARAATLAQEFDQRRRQFYARVAPLLVGLMDRAGARAVFDENSALLTDQTLNITDEVIAAIDDQGDEGATPAAPDPAQAAPQPVLPVPPALEPLAPAETTPPASLLPDEVRPAPRPEGGN
jgi:Skp family chaperone for outer membrane proteins